jgi:two-component system, OmpR family, sensor histidine kinase SenX3
MRSGGRRKSIALFIALGACLVAGVVALNVGWIILNWREAGLLIAGLIVFPLIITGVVLNTIFLVREIRRNEQHEAFINAVTHELKTPVASMKLYLQTLQNRQVEDAKRQEFYGVMLQDSDRLLGTIEQVLRAGQLGAKLRRASPMPVDFGAVVEECLGLARRRHHLPSEAVTSTVRHVNGASFQVLGDEEDLKAMVSNLVDNAIKYSGPEVHVAVELEQADAATATLRVRDRGIGISPSERKRIFKRFYRIPGAMSTRVKGTGLGLFIVRSVVARHGGKVFVESDGTGQGSTFIVQLPVVEPHVAAR